MKLGNPKNQRPHIGFAAQKNIKKGEELFYHSGVDLACDEFPWIRQIQKPYLWIVCFDIQYSYYVCYFNQPGYCRC